MENKRIILDLLLAAVQQTRAGSDIVDLQYMPESEEVAILYISGGKKYVNVACDSGVAMIRDVMRAIN